MNKSIFFIAGSMGKGGAERVISILANYYSSIGWNVTICTLLNNSVEYEIHKEIRIVHIKGIFNNYLANSIPWVIGLRKQIKASQPDVIISFICRINILTIFSAIGIKSRKIISERNDPRHDGRGFAIKLLANLSYPLADQVIFQSKEVQRLFTNKIIKKSDVIMNPIKIETSRSKIIDKNKIVSIGRLVQQKNHSLLIDAFISAHKINKNLKLFIYGEGPLRTYLQEKIYSLKLENHVFLEGQSDAVQTKISDASLFVLSSDFEGLSNALMEAMTLGIPCISTECAGSKEIISNNINGILTPIGSSSEISSAIIRLINDESLYEHISQNSISSSQKFSLNSIMKQWSNSIERFD